MSRRSTPSFAIGGATWLDHRGGPGDAMIPPPEGGWRCFHCNAWFPHWRSALRHFGAPGSTRLAACDPTRKQIAMAISDPGATEGYKGERSLTAWQADAVMRVIASSRVPASETEMRQQAVKRYLASAEAALDGLDDDNAEKAWDDVTAALRVMETDSLSVYQEAVKAMERLTERSAPATQPEPVAAHGEPTIPRGDWYGYDRYVDGKFEAGYLLDRDQEPELREVAKFNCRGLAESIGNLIAAALRTASPKVGEDWPSDGTCRTCGHVPRSPETGLCATCADEIAYEARRRNDALATAFALLDSFAGDGLVHVYGNGQELDASEVCTELASAFGIEAVHGWERCVADALVLPSSPVDGEKGK